MIICGCCIIPVINFLYLELRKTAYITSKMFWIASLLASMGVVGIGIFPENKSTIHHSIAAFVFFGFMYAFCCNIYTVGKIWKNRLSLSRKIWSVVIYFQLIVAMGGFLLAFSQYGLYYFWGLYWPPINLYLPLWEWIVFGSYLIYIASIFYLIPTAVVIEE